MSSLQKNILPDDFAMAEYREYSIYSTLAAREKNPHFKKILNQLVAEEKNDFEFWNALSQKKSFHVSKISTITIILLRRIFGITFTARYLERGERNIIAQYTSLLPRVDEDTRTKIQHIILHEKEHEVLLISQFRETKIEFVSSIVLGLNDGLIELSGALVGFASAFSNHTTVAITGTITGIAASMSMASSAYMQARHEEGKNPRLAALYTGISYTVVVIALVLPYIFIPSIYGAMIVMFGVVIAIVVGLSFYTSVLFDRKFFKQFREMFIFSVGVAFVAYLIGSMVRYFST